MTRNRALLVIGPTGSGKTPLGELLAKEGWGGARCHHFDFGAELRRVAAGEGDRRFSAEEAALVGDVLERGALLEDQHFIIAEKILRFFIERCAVGPDDVILLNGLPRHAGQAEAVDRLLDVQAVISLSCAPEVVRERIAADSGGDRAGRPDDGLAEVKRKLIIFRERTAPLVERYRAGGARVHEFEVGPGTTPGEILGVLGGGWEMLKADATVLLVVDVQGKLARLMHGREDLFANLGKLIRGARVLELPIVWAEQNPAGLGPTIPEVSGFMPEDLAPVPKFSFSCCGEPRFLEALEKTGRKQVLICGIEAHICVYQTALELKERGCEVHLVADAVSSRNPLNRDVALMKLGRGGVRLTTVEMALFEMLRVAEGPRFKEIVKIVK